MYAFTMYVAEWLTDILVESSTGTRPSMIGLYDVYRTSSVRWMKNRELTIGCIKVTQKTVVHFEPTHYKNYHTIIVMDA